MSDATMQKPAVLSALEFERRRLLRAGVGERADIICIGTGPEAIVNWAEREGAQRGRVILAGLSAGLRQTIAPGEAFIASSVIGRGGRQYRAAPPLESANVREESGGDAPARAMVSRAVVGSPDSVLRTPREKATFAEKTGADLADLESGLFAEAATVFGWRWTIVRGVSDGVNETMPPGVERWVDGSGRVRAERVAMSVILRPWTLASLSRLRRHSNEAMDRAAGAICTMLDAEARAAGDAAW